MNRVRETLKAVQPYIGLVLFGVGVVVFARNHDGAIVKSVEVGLGVLGIAVSLVMIIRSLRSKCRRNGSR